MPERSDDANACLVSDRFSNRNKSALHEIDISPLTDIVDESTWISLERKAANGTEDRSQNSEPATLKSEALF